MLNHLIDSGSKGYHLSLTDSITNLSLLEVSSHLQLVVRMRLQVGNCLSLIASFLLVEKHWSKMAHKAASNVCTIAMWEVMTVIRNALKVFYL